MVYRLAAALLAALAAFAPAASADSDDPFGADWPPGPGRELTGALCGGCHSLNLVKQQGLTRAGWDELLTWMTEKQNMPKLEGARREQVLDYLAANFGVDRGGAAPPAGAQQGIRRAPLGIRPPD